MKITKLRRLLSFCLILSILLLILVSCQDDDTELSQSSESTTAEINQWILDYMDLAYYWSEDMPTIDTETESDPETFFYQLLKTPEDRWSFITDDIDELLDYFQGITKSMGYSIQLYYLNSNSEQLVAIVEYVYSDTPASEAGLDRGDMIVEIDNQIITLDNYEELLSLETMEITLGTITNSTLVELTPTVNLVAREINTNPIVKDTILEIDDIKIGYLAYTSFISNYDDQLVDVFTEFKSSNIDELVLDLRYNGGGSVNTALLMASLIAPSSAINDVFINEIWNTNLTEYNDTLKLYEQEANVNLDNLYVLTTEGTASASEMVIYGLEPYMNIIQIGDTTTGKYYASITLYDEERTHDWGIQPLVLRAENKTNSINYSEGLPYDYEADDIYYNAPLGDPEEQFFEIAISLITTGSIPATSQIQSTKTSIISKKYNDLLDPLKTTMVVPFQKE
jgi:C-terminal processing protease CtpA/Prc